jgi:hypothetical protein
MRRIISKSEKNKKTKRTQWILGGILILLMAFSTLGYALSGRGDEESNNKIVEYKGIEFIQDNSGYWYFVIQGQQFIILNNPENISEINFLSTLTFGAYSNKPLYFVGDLGEGSSEISRNLADRFVLRIQQACLDEEDCEGNFPIKNCSSDNIIIFKEILNNKTEDKEIEENKTKINEIEENEIEMIYQEENCVFIYSQYENQSKYADKFLFTLLGI